MRHIDHNLPSGYAISAYVLIVEHRVCETCGKEHITPSPHLSLEMVNRHGATRLISLQGMDKIYSQIKVQLRQEQKMPTLPRKHRHVDVYVPACIGCFQETSDREQDLFHSTRPRTREQVREEVEYSEILMEEYGRLPTKEELDWYKKQKRKEKKRADGSGTSARATKKPGFNLHALIQKWK